MGPLWCCRARVCGTPAGNPISYDRAYYVGEQDYYLPRGENVETFKRYDSPSASKVDDLEEMKSLAPTHIVFNGVTGALQGAGQLTANVGENVLIIHSQANRQSYPHLIGGHGDYVWERGGFSSPRGGGSGDVGDCCRFRRGVDTHHPATGNLRLPVAQPHRGVCLPMPRRFWSPRENGITT